MGLLGAGIGSEDDAESGRAGILSESLRRPRPENTTRREESGL